MVEVNRDCLAQRQGTEVLGSYDTLRVIEVLRALLAGLDLDRIAAEIVHP